MEKPKTLQQAIRYFSDEQVCIDTVAAMRWPDGVACPACQKKDHYYLKSQKRWKCKECGRQFSVKLGTIFEDSPIGLDKWLTALWMLANCKNGVSSYEIHRAIGVTQKSAWFMLHRLRLGLQEPNLGSKLGGNEGGEVEIDETFVGGKVKNMHKDRKVRYNQQRGATGKAVVMGILDRDLRKVRAKVVPDVKRDTLQAEVLKEVKYGSKVYTDDAVAYDKLQWRYVHEVVNKTESYVKGRVHVNGMENFWSLLKRGLNGTYVAVEPFHLFRYVDEQIFRYNNRSTKDKPMTDADRFELALSQIARKRLTYAEVTGKVGETTA
jgi:transposase-like protein